MTKTTRFRIGFLILHAIRNRNNKESILTRQCVEEEDETQSNPLLSDIQNLDAAADTAEVDTMIVDMGASKPPPTGDPTNEQLKHALNVLITYCP